MLAKRIELQQNIRLVCAFEVQVWGRVHLKQEMLCKHYHIFLWILFLGKVKFCTLTCILVFLYSCILVFLYSCILAFLDKKGIFTAIFASNSINSLNKGANVSNKTIFFSF